jgi:hypothetical protein
MDIGARPDVCGLFNAFNVYLERGPLSLVRITNELLEWKSRGSGLENRD